MSALPAGVAPLQRSLSWIRRNLIDEVPPAIAHCEFECREPQCPEGGWGSCARRRQAASLLQA